MRVATRLVVTLSVAVGLLMVAYTLLSTRQRETLLRDALIRETETLAQALQIVVDNALRDRRSDDLRRVLAELLRDPETFVAVVLDEQGEVLAGGADRETGCLRDVFTAPASPVQAERGWASCRERVRWVTLPLAPPAARLILARRATVIDAELGASRLRLSLLTATLIALAALIITLVLRRILSEPLAAILQGVRSLGEPGPPRPIRVAPSAGELADLATAFNEMARELEARHQSLLRETEERIGLERRLVQAEKYATVGRMSGGLAHELGSPLSVIALRAEAIAEDPSAPDPARRHAAAIVREVDRISQLVQGLLHAGRRHGIRPEPVVLQDVIREALDHAAPYTTGAGVEVCCEVPSQPTVVPGQSVLLRHAVLNLVRNAAQALAGHRGERRIRVAVERTAASVRIVVEDTGPGITAEHLPHVFEPFYSTKQVGEGAGLGLPVSAGIAEEHGGDLRLEARRDGGVRAILTLPAETPSLARERDA